ncbi:MAG: neocarzinostatin apoprotein domain-containing protein [Nocardioidaceae bacterium]
MLGRAVLVCVSLVTLGGALVSSPASADDPAKARSPRVAVSPSTGLARGDVVTVKVRRVPPGASVDLFQCDVVEAGTTPRCGPALATATASRRGLARAAVTLQDPLFRNEEFGDPTPVYCRSDVCRIIATWPGGDGELRVVASAPLRFAGAPASIALSDTEDLVDGEQVVATGTASGAAGRRVVFTEEACFSIVQGSGCYGQTDLGESVVHRDGTFRRLLTVQRFLSDGSDCADQANLLGACEVSATILGADGLPDDTFGLASRGQPAAFVTFVATY